MSDDKHTEIEEAFHIIGLFVWPMGCLLFGITLWVMMPKQPMQKGKNPYINEAKAQEEIQDSLRKRGRND